LTNGPQAARVARVTAEDIAAARAVELETMSKRVEELTKRYVGKSLVPIP
jgi:hypothetical protein